MARNRVIGKDNALAWDLPEDLRRFKKMTSGHPVIMGRRTYESMGRPLPNRDNLIVSRQNQYRVDGAQVFPTVESAIQWCQEREALGQKGFDEIFIIGGAEIWSASWHLLDRLYLTIIHKDFEGDAYFPSFDPKQWREVFREDHLEPMPYSYYTFERISR
ncbi:MAG: dihydrofolate reductase [Bdellovibrionales bacterium]|nr:dihydrofolate reductase [Bdellovibrionales bacterium]